MIFQLIMCLFVCNLQEAYSTCTLRTRRESKYSTVCSKRTSRKNNISLLNNAKMLAIVLKHGDMTQPVDLLPQQWGKMPILRVIFINN